MRQRELSIICIGPRAQEQRSTQALVQDAAGLIFWTLFIQDISGRYICGVQKARNDHCVIVSEGSRAAPGQGNMICHGIKEEGERSSLQGWASLGLIDKQTNKLKVQAATGTNTYRPSTPYLSKQRAHSRYKGEPMNMESQIQQEKKAHARLTEYGSRFGNWWPRILPWTKGLGTENFL